MNHGQGCQGQCHVHCHVQDHGVGHGHVHCHVHCHTQGVYANEFMHHEEVTV